MESCSTFRKGMLVGLSNANLIAEFVDEQADLHLSFLQQTSRVSRLIWTFLVDKMLRDWFIGPT